MSDLPIPESDRVRSCPWGDCQRSRKCSLTACSTQHIPIADREPPDPKTCSDDEIIAWEKSNGRKFVGRTWVEADYDHRVGDWMRAGLCFFWRAHQRVYQHAHERYLELNQARQDNADDLAIALATIQTLNETIDDRDREIERFQAVAEAAIAFRHTDHSASVSQPIRTAFNQAVDEFESATVRGSNDHEPTT